MTNDFVESQSNFNLGKFRLILQLKVVNNIVPMMFLVSFCSLFHYFSTTHYPVIDRGHGSSVTLLTK